MDHPSAPLLNFLSLQHSSDQRVHIRQNSNSVFVPPSGFGYPLDGLLLSGPSHLREMAALLGFTSPKHADLRYECVTAYMNPHAVHRTSNAETEISVRRRRPRLLGFDPQVLPSNTQAHPSGFHEVSPSRVTMTGLDPPSRGILLSCACCVEVIHKNAMALQSFNRPVTSNI
jgi:hypothetical protein